jgi:hypothetical protein
VSPFGLDRKLIIGGRSMLTCRGLSGFHRRGDETMGTGAVGNNYEDECRRSLAEEQAKSLAGTNNWEHVDREQVHRDWDVLYRELTALLDGGSLPGDQQIQELVRRHFDIACRFYTPSIPTTPGWSISWAPRSRCSPSRGAGSPPAHGPRLRRSRAARARTCMDGLILQRCLP